MQVSFPGSKEKQALCSRRAGAERTDPTVRRQGKEAGQRAAAEPEAKGGEGTHSTPASRRSGAGAAGRGA
eukprot:5553260-Pyramimonas_sp.AAC.1